jgi:hypothetical protein
VGGAGAKWSAAGEGDERECKLGLGLVFALCSGDPRPDTRNLRKSKERRSPVPRLGGHRARKDDVNRMITLPPLWSLQPPPGVQAPPGWCSSCGNFFCPADINDQSRICILALECFFYHRIALRIPVDSECGSIGFCGNFLDVSVLRK